MLPEGSKDYQGNGAPAAGAPPGGAPAQARGAGYPPPATAAPTAYGGSPAVSAPVYGGGAAVAGAGAGYGSAPAYRNPAPAQGGYAAQPPQQGYGVGGAAPPAQQGYGAGGYGAAPGGYGGGYGAPTAGYATQAPAAAPQKAQPPPAAKPPAAAQPKCRALYAFAAEESNEISFGAGDILIITKAETGSDWWLGRKEGSTQDGLFPSAYVERI